MAKGKASLTREYAGTMSFGKAMLTGVGIVAAAFIVAMMRPLASDLYGVAKNWLLQDEQPPQ